MPSTNPSQKRYPPELKERAVRMVVDLRRADPADHGVIARIARQLGVGAESLRGWVKQADVDAGARPGMASDDHAELVELRKEVKDCGAPLVQALAELERLGRRSGAYRPWRRRPPDTGS